MENNKEKPMARAEFVDVKSLLNVFGAQQEGATDKAGKGPFLNVTATPQFNEIMEPVYQSLIAGCDTDEQLDGVIANLKKMISDLCMEMFDVGFNFCRESILNAAAEIGVSNLEPGEFEELIDSLEP